ncbi:MAG: hypothetical protein HRT74_05400, partial [Flavobacteriales bacterium]|nr:hypothetical protein [Flavobacteriales bacterium]
MIGTEFAIRNKENSIEISGSGAFNKKFGVEEDDTGHAYNINLDKISGQWNYGVSHFVESVTYDPNDFGFLFAANSNEFFAYANYNIFEPFWKLNRMRAGASAYYERVFA